MEITTELTQADRPLRLPRVTVTVPPARDAWNRRFRVMAAAWDKSLLEVGGQVYVVIETTQQDGSIETTEMVLPRKVFEAMSAAWMAATGTETITVHVKED